MPDPIPPTTPDSKPAIQSVGVMGGATALVSILTTIIVARTNLPPDAVSSLIAPLIVGVAGAVASIWGRIKAKVPVKGVVSSPAPSASAPHEDPQS